MDHINIQFSSILITLLAGMVFGIFFDVYRVFRGKIWVRKGRNQGRRSVFNFVGDLCFWTFEFILITPIIFWGTWLELRLYVWLLILAGIGLYFGIFSPAVIPLILGIWQILTWVPRKLAIAVGHFKIILKKVSWWLGKRGV